MSTSPLEGSRLRVRQREGGRLTVLKIGGSIFRSPESYVTAAEFVAGRLNGAGLMGRPAERLVVIVSAQYGMTDALLAEAHAIAPSPRDTALDLLWSTGELRSVALLTLHLQRLGVDAVPFNVHQTGLVADEDRGVSVRPLRLLAALAEHRLVILPGFLGVSAGGVVRSLGRGGSDLTAVLLAAAIRADRCELIKDVPGYHSSDPNTDSGAQPIPELSIDEALAIADGGCDLVQRAALVAAADAHLPLIVRSLQNDAPVSHVGGQVSRVREGGGRSADRPDTGSGLSSVRQRSQYGIRNEDDSRRPAVRA